MLSWLRHRAMQARPDVPPDGESLDAENLDAEILACLEDVLDPEVEISIVHLGLIYRAQRMPERIEVDMTLTTRTCPLGSLLVEKARLRLERRFGSGRHVAVRLVHSPTWTPDRITERGRELLGHGSFRESLHEPRDLAIRPLS